MVSVKIFVEGGGEGKDLKSRCREGFSKLIKKMGFAGRMPRIVACGGRQSAYDMFNIAMTSVGYDEYPILLVDSEDPISSNLPWEHLYLRDSWDRPADASDDQATDDGYLHGNVDNGGSRVPAKGVRFLPSARSSPPCEQIRGKIQARTAGSAQICYG